MLFTLSSNIIDKIYISISNAYENYTTKIWNSNIKHSATCRQCGKRITPINCKYSPNACGWRKLKSVEDISRIHNWGWLCHSCDGHFNEHFIKIDNLNDKDFQYLKDKGVIPSYIER